MKRLTFLFFFSQFFILGLFAEDITISSAEELIAFQKSVNDLEEGFDYSGSTIYLANDINLEDIDWIPIGTERRPFRGTFDGGGHWIHNLTVKIKNGNYAGLFGYIGEGGIVQKLGISGGSVEITKKTSDNVQCYVGGIAAYSEGTISQCANLATIYGNQTFANVGGIVGMIASIENTEIYGVVENCYNLGRLYTSKDYEQHNYLGGIAGNCDDGTISRVYVDASIESGSISSPRVGGIVAVQTFDSDVSNAYYSEGNAYYDEYDELCGESMLGFALDGKLNDPQDGYSIWSFAEGRLPLLTCMLELLKGDVNMDGQVSIADVTALVNIILGKDNVPPYLYDHVAANVNEDEGVSIADVTALVNIILGKEEEVTSP